MEKIDDLLVFAKVVETLSFTKAAEALNSSRSLISQKVTKLEQRYGVQLLQRTTRRLNLTEEGRTLYEHCLNLKRTLEEAEQALGNARNTPQGNLKMVAPVTFSQMFLTDIISEFLQKYPKIKLKLSLSDSVTDLVAEGFDLAIRIGSLSDSSLKARKLGATRIIALAHREYLSTYPQLQHPDDLVQHNCLIYKYRGDRENRWLFQKGQEQYSVKVEGNFSADNGLPLLQAASKGLGVAYVPDFMVNSPLDSQMVEVLSDYCYLQHGIYAVYPFSRQEKINVRLFIDYVANKFSKGIGNNLAQKALTT